MVNHKKKNKNKKKSHQKALNASHSAEHTEDHQEQIEDLEDDLEEHDEKVAKSHKRQYGGDDDSDVEDKPQKKKKKKQGVATETSDKKGKISIRQMKREKFAQRQAEAQATAKDHLKGQCINYLSQWKHDKQNWKFMKSKQVWIYKNKFSSHLLPDSSWPLFLEYFESAKGNVRNMLLDDAKRVIKQMDEWTESQNDQPVKKDEEEDENNEDGDKPPKTMKPDDNVYKRARDLIQCLEE